MRIKWGCVLFEEMPDILDRLHGISFMTCHVPKKNFYTNSSHFRSALKVPLLTITARYPVTATLITASYHTQITRLYYDTNQRYGDGSFLIPLPFRQKAVNPLTPNDPYSGRTAPLNSKRCILYTYSTNTGTEYFKRGIYSPFFFLQNAVCLIILMYMVPVLFTFYIFIQQIWVLNILNMVYTLRFFLFKMPFVS